mgnify:CR=1 FL=1
MRKNPTKGSESGNPQQKLKILLVEDNPADVMLFTMLTSKVAPHVELFTVEDGEEATDFLMKKGSFAHAKPVDIVLLDLNLPKKSGIEVLAEIRLEPKLRDLPIFILTTSNSVEDKERAEALNIASFLTKSVDITELEGLFRHLFDVLIPVIITNTKTSESSVPTIISSAPEKTEVSAEGFRLLVEAVTDYAIFMLDPEGYIMTWNEGAQRIKQYSRNEIIGKHFSIFYTPEDVRSNHPAHELELAEKDGRYQEEGWRVRRDGVKLWASVTITAVRDKDGKLIGFGKVTRDMTERKLTDEKMRLNEERFRLLIDGVRDYAIFLLDPAGHIVSWNKGAERINGYKASEILGRHFSTFYTEEAKRKNHPQTELRIASEKGMYEEEGIRVRKDGTPFWANVVITALFETDGNLKGFAKITRDITDRKKAEQKIYDANLDLERRVEERTAELEKSKQDIEESKLKLEEQKEELMRSNSDLLQFAYVASHDLQEPLRMIISYLQLLQRTNSENVDAQGKEFIDFAISGAYRMRALVRDLLSYAGIEKSNKIPTVIQFNTVLNEIRANLSQLLEETHTKLTVGPLPELKADPIQMGQIFQNLITNAITYRSPERDAEIQIDAKQGPGEHWTFSVKDNGIGISPEYFQKIFVIFQRLHSDREKFPGTGIGLAICKKIVERHRGKIWLESEPGKGTTFFFSLPKK